MDTLIVPIPRRRAYGGLALAALLVVVAVLSDPGGRLLAVPAAVGVLAVCVRDLTLDPLLSADGYGLVILQGLRHRRVAWARVERMRVVQDRRAPVLELDLGSTLVLLSKQRLGRHPDDILTDLLAVRSPREGTADDLREADGPV
jgi:hypothetical protein